jgi:hypothetical protein
MIVVDLICKCKCVAFVLKELKDRFKKKKYIEIQKDKVIDFESIISASKE